jgi:hypothetical protein
MPYSQIMTMKIKNRWLWIPAALAAVAALLGLQTASAAKPRAAAVAPVVTQLQLTPAYVAAGRSAKAVLDVTATAPVAASKVTVAVRNSANANLDFPGAATDVTITPTGFTLTTGARTFTAGTYKIFGSWRDAAGAWHSLPVSTLTVGKAAPAPEPTPTSPSPTPTATPTPTPTVTATPTPTPTATTGTGPSWDQAGAWNAKFADEFNGTALDKTKWSDGWFGTGVTGPVNSAETVKYNSANVSVSGGLLHLKLDTQGAHINSDGKFSFSRGAVEYRALFPAKDGKVANWPALWDNGQSWPRDGENDTAEGLDGDMCSFWHSTGLDRGKCHGSSLAGSFHTFGYEWDASKVVWYYDGVKVHEQATTVASPHYLILQNTRGEFGGPALSPADLQVDYVRVWQR